MKRESTPFTTIKVKTDDDRSIWARFYWSQNSGIHGYQVITEYNTGDGFEKTKTNGYGFCKESAAFESFTRRVFPALTYDQFDGLGGQTLQEMIWSKNGVRPGRDIVMSLDEFKALVTQ